MSSSIHFQSIKAYYSTLLLLDSSFELVLSMTNSRLAQYLLEQVVIHYASLLPAHNAAQAFKMPDCLDSFGCSDFENIEMTFAQKAISAHSFIVQSYENL